MKVLFVGSVDFSLHCLREVQKIRDYIQLVGVMNPDSAYARFNSDYVDLEPIAQAYNIPFFRIRKINDPENIPLIRSLNPDVIFVFGFSQLISNELLKFPRLGCIGSHPALLPRNRGRHPLIWSLVEGLSESGLTFLYLDEGIDSGDILWQKPFPITSDDTSAALYEKIKLLASQAIAEFIPQLAEGKAPRIPQDHSKATYWRKRTEQDGEIKWKHSAMASYNLIRALTHPYIGAHTYLGGIRVIVWKSNLFQPATDQPLGTPGEILDYKPGYLLVQCGNGALKITDWETSESIGFKTGLIFGKQES